MLVEFLIIVSLMFIAYLITLYKVSDCEEIEIEYSVRGFKFKTKRTKSDKHEKH